MPRPAKLGIATATMSTGEKRYYFIHETVGDDGQMAVSYADAWSHRPNLPPMRMPPDYFSEITLYP
ncbi:hypothetical protein ACFRMQ_21730 [Kitasatospora sp. NPDC056783]|uniref:hypothetical protein n=1 Tax=Kitasatospora sp. NPDC056783 TaxID=3345943 RepID=UPI0036CDCB9B